MTSTPFAPLIPRFAVVVKDMVQRELVELVFTAHYQDWPNTPSLTMAEVEHRTRRPRYVDAA